MTVSVLWLFIMVPWVGLQCVVVIFLDILTYLFKVFNLSDVYLTPVACSAVDYSLFIVAPIVLAIVLLCTYSCPF